MLFDICDLINNVVSESRDTLNTISKLLFVTVISFDVFGTADANVHSSSSLVAAVLFCAMFELGGGEPTPSKSTPPTGLGEGWGFIDCWNWKGDPCLGVVDARVAKGSGVDLLGRPAGVDENAEVGRGDFCGGRPELIPPKRSLMDCVAVTGCGCDCWTGMPDKPSTASPSETDYVVSKVRGGLT